MGRMTIRYALGFVLVVGPPAGAEQQIVRFSAVAIVLGAWFFVQTADAASSTPESSRHCADYGTLGAVSGSAKLTVLTPIALGIATEPGGRFPPGVAGSIRIRPRYWRRFGVRIVGPLYILHRLSAAGAAHRTPSSQGKLYQGGTWEGWAFLRFCCVRVCFPRSSAVRKPVKTGRCTVTI